MISTKGGLHFRVRHQGLVSRHSFVSDTLDAADALANDTHGGGIIELMGQGQGRLGTTGHS